MEVSGVLLNGEDGSNEYTGHSDGVLTVLPSNEAAYLSLSTDYLNYGMATTGDTLDLGVTLYNSGLEDILITDVACSSPFINVDDNFTVPGSGSYTSHILFAPLSECVYTDQLRFYTADDELQVLLYGISTQPGEE